MSKRLRMTILVAVLVVAGGLAKSEPIFFQPSALPDEALSLAGIDALRLEIQEMPVMLKDAHITASSVQEEIEQIFDASGFKRADDDRGPKCVVSIDVAEDREEREQLSMAVVLAVHQRVRVHRLEQDLRTPTVVFYRAAMSTPSKVKKDLLSTVRMMAQLMRSTVEQATAEHEAAGQRR